MQNWDYLDTKTELSLNSRLQLRLWLFGSLRCRCGCNRGWSQLWRRLYSSPSGRGRLLKIGKLGVPKTHYFFSVWLCKDIIHIWVNIGLKNLCVTFRPIDRKKSFKQFWPAKSGLYIEYQRIRGKCNILMLIRRVWHLSGSALPWRHLVGYLDVPLTSHFGYLDVPVASHTLLANLSSHLLAACPSTSTRTCKWLSVQLQCEYYYYLHLDQIKYRVSFCYNPLVITGNLGLFLSLLFWGHPRLTFWRSSRHGKPFLPSEPWFGHLGHILGSFENGPYFPGDA